MSLRASSAGCCVITSTHDGHPQECGRAPVYAARWPVPGRPGRAWRVFVCTEHRERLAPVVTDLRPLTNGDAEALQVDPMPASSLRQREPMFIPGPRRCPGGCT